MVYVVNSCTVYVYIHVAIQDMLQKSLNTRTLHSMHVVHNLYSRIRSLIPVVGQESFGEHEPSLLVAFDVVGPLL